MRSRAQAAAKISREMCQFFFLLWFTDRNKTHAGLWKCDNGLQRLDKKLENLAGHAKSLVNDVFNCGIKFYGGVVIYCMISKKQKESYDFLRDLVGHIPQMCPAVFKHLTTAPSVWKEGTNLYE